MTLQDQRAQFEHTRTVYESARLTFQGLEGFDVYNTSTPFSWQGKRYLFGRVERRSEWARSWVRLFEASGPDEWTLSPGSMIYPLEDPFICQIGNLLVLGGTHVRYKAGALDTFYGYFFRGRDLNDLVYFTTGPEGMKDIRLVELADGRIGVFSRPRHPGIERQYGSAAQIGFTVIDSLDGLTAAVIDSAPYIFGLFGEGEWGGVNQAYLLKDGTIGVIGHKSYQDVTACDQQLAVYLNVAFEFDPVRHEAANDHIIGTRSCYPPGPAKRPELVDCAFTSGIVQRQDGRTDLYSGIGDVEEGRIVIDYPFSKPLA
jgi:hypothetical protein